MLTTRRATQADAELIAAHRHAMFAAMEQSNPAALGQMRRNFVPWVERMIGFGKYIGWIVEDGGLPVASGGFFELEWPPHPLDPAGEHRGYLLNFWVEPEYRERGVARGLVREALAESRRRGIRATALHASEAGRPVYEATGFHASNEMIWLEDSVR
jgi:ribosomal protein S18 acetylase RimI-like enzyme